MAAGDVAHDRQAEPGAGFILVARRVEPVERPEHILACVGRDARTVIVDGDGQPPAAVDARRWRPRRHAGRRWRPDWSEAVKGVRADIDLNRRPAPITFTVAPRSRPSAATFSTTLVEAHHADILLGFAAGEGQVAVEHRLHVVDVLVQRVELRSVADQRELKPEAGEDGAQVVADARKHGGALLDLALDALAHLDEGDAGAPDLIGAAGRKSSGMRWPLPKLSAAWVSFRIGRIWPRRNRMAMTSSTSEVPTIHNRKIWVLEA
jgi:hypothetical protein